MKIINNVKEDINNSISNSIEGVKQSVAEGIKEGLNNIWDGILNVLHSNLDGIFLFGLLSTLLLNMMGVKNAGSWCYAIFAFYIVFKIMIKALLLI